MAAQQHLGETPQLLPPLELDLIQELFQGGVAPGTRHPSCLLPPASCLLPPASKPPVFSTRSYLRWQSGCHRSATTLATIKQTIRRAASTLSHHCYLVEAGQSCLLPGLPHSGCFPAVRPDWPASSPRICSPRIDSCVGGRPSPWGHVGGWLHRIPQTAG